MKYDIIPEYRLQKKIKYLLATVALSLIITSLIMKLSLLTFIGVIFTIITALYTLLSTKPYLKIDNQTIKVETNGIVNLSDEETNIKIKDIEELYFLNRQFMIGNLFTRNQYADADDQRAFHNDRIVFKLKENKSKTIFKIGTKEEFYKAYEVIKDKVDEKIIQ